MVSGDQIQQILNDPLRYAVEYRYILICIAALAAAVLAMALGATKKSKPKKREPVIVPLDFAADARVQPPVQPYSAPAEPIPAPHPQPHDIDYARKTLGLDAVSPEQGRQLYFDGVRKNDLHMAMTGLRFLAQYASEGGARSYTSPWWEYRELAQSYLSLARAHNSRPCLELAREAFATCYAAIYPEPSTERPAREVLQNLQLLSAELAVRPGG